MPVLAFLFAKMGLSLSTTAIKLIMLGLVVLTVVGVIFAGYRHFENERTALIAATRAAAQQEIEAKFAQKSAELTRQAQATQAKAMTNFNDVVAKQNATIDDLQDQIQDIPDEAPAPAIIVSAPSLPDTPTTHPKPKTPYGELAHVHATPRHVDASPLPDVSRLDASLNRMLERASGNVGP